MRRVDAIVVALLAGACLAGRCGGGDGGNGRPSVAEIKSPDPRCAALPDPFGFPPGYDFVPELEGRALASIFTEPTLIPLDVRSEPFRVPDDAQPTPLPSDADGDGCSEFAQAVDDLFVPERDLALVTLSAYEAVLFADPAGGLREIVLETPEAGGPIDPLELALWPPPGEAERRTGVPNFTCIAVPEGTLDSRGDPVAARPSAIQGCRDPEPSVCRSDRPSYRASFTSGVALAGGRLFTSVSNLGDDPGEEDTQYLPAALTVYDVDESGSRPRLSPTPTPDGAGFVLGGEGRFNYSHVQRHVRPDGRELILATATGPIGIVPDDPGTGVIEGGSRRLGEGAIDVFDPLALRRIATYPLREANPAFTGLAIDPRGRIAATGDVTARWVLAVDLTPLDDLPDPTPAGAPVTDLSDAVLFDGRRPLEVPGLDDGAPVETCPGWIESVAWNDAGDLLYALDACDGTLTAFLVEPNDDRPRRGDFVRGPTVELTAPVRTDTLGQPRLPSKVKVRDGTPGVDFDGPDVFFLVSDPEALLCGIEAE